MDAVKTAICVVGLSYNILSAITAMRLIQLRACLHVVNVSICHALRRCRRHLTRCLCFACSGICPPPCSAWPVWS